MPYQQFEITVEPIALILGRMNAVKIFDMIIWFAVHIILCLIVSFLEFRVRLQYFTPTLHDQK